MRQLTLRTTTLALIACFSAVAPLGAQDSTATRLLSAGMYTGDQAKRGEETYRTSCLDCHSAANYTGEKFRKSWLLKTVYDLFEQIRTKMPDDNPGSLSRQQYSDVVAYLLSLNGYPAGEKELSTEADELRLVKIDSLPAGGASPHFAHRAFPSPHTRLR